MTNTNTEQFLQAVLNLQEWQAARKHLEHYKNLEMKLRKEIFGVVFPLPKEGTNTVPLQNGWSIKGIRKVDRKLDPAALNALAEEIDQVGIARGKIIAYTPELVLKEYRTLTDEQRLVFDQVLTIKDGAPSMELIAPKEV